MVGMDHAATKIEGVSVTSRAMMRSWADRVVRIYASAAFQLAGFSTAATALASTPEIIDDDTASEARSRVNAALRTVLSAREVPQIEQALVAAFAAREALALVQHREPSSQHMKRLVETLHSIA